MTRNPTFAILRNGGNVELFEVKERTPVSKQSTSEYTCRDKSVFSVGSLAESMITTLAGREGTIHVCRSVNWSICGSVRSVSRLVIGQLAVCSLNY